MKSMRLFGFLNLMGLLLVCAASELPHAGQAQTSGPGPNDSLREYIRRSQYRQAYGVYLNGQKVGWGIIELKLGKLKRREVAENNTEMHIRIRMGSEEANSDSYQSEILALEGDGSLIQARERLLENKSETIRTVERRGDQIIITTRSPGNKTVRRVPLPKENLALDRALERWLQGPPQVGSQFESWTTEWTEEMIDRREIYTFKGHRTIPWNGTNLEACVVSFNTDGMEMEGWLLPNGKLLKGRVGGLFELRAEPEAAARDISHISPVDYQKMLAIKVDQDLGLPARVERLSIEISGLGDFKMPSSHRQVVKPEVPGAARVELRRDFRIEKPAPLSAEERRRYLAATPSIQTEEKPIIALARRITRGEKDPIAASERIVAWMRHNLKQRQGVNASTAMEVLKTKTGDCTEHSLLFVTLARACGIPARQASGVAFVREDQPSFYWHEWAEIHDGRQWVTVDPTWNQIRVDATHLEFSDDPEDWSWVNLLGRLKIKVIDFSSRKS